MQEKENNQQEKKLLKNDNLLYDMAKLASFSMKSLKNDTFSQAFIPKPTRTYKWTTKLYVYLYLLPLRLTVLTLTFIPITITLLFALKFNETKLISKCFLWYSKILCWCFGAKIKNHGIKSLNNQPAVFVANHSSFLDYLVVSTHKIGHAVLSQNHKGLFDFFFRILEKNGSLGFKRYEKKDKKTVRQKLKNHVEKKLTPMLIFPEGTCVNNKYSVMFQKGAFELGVNVHPVTIKYNISNFDPYWNRRSQSFLEHLFFLFTTISFNVDVFYHEPIRKKRNESSSEFSERCQNLISKKGDLKILLWDGYLKNGSTLKADRLLLQSFLYSYCSNKDFIDLSYGEFMQNVSRNYLKVLNKKLKIYKHKLSCLCVQKN